MLRIGICDDIQIHRKTLECFINDYFSNKHITFECHQFTSGDDLIKYYTNNKLDLIFLDIIMDGHDGIETAREIRKNDLNVDIIFCTSHADFALDSYDVFAFGYMLKPFDIEKFHMLLDRYILSNTITSDKHLIVKSSYRKVSIPFYQIVYIESEDKALFIHLQDQTVVKCYAKLSDVLTTLNSEASFLQCHQSFIVNMKHIARIEEDVFITKDNAFIPIRKKELRKMQEIFHNFIS